MAIVLGVVQIVLAIAALDMLKNQGRNILSIMATFKEFQDQLAVIATATDGISDSTLNISEDLKRLADAITQGGIDAVSEAELLTVLTASATKLSEAATKLKEVADINPEPIVVPPVDPPVVG
jgi:uncharacterized protein YoxC